MLTPVSPAASLANAANGLKAAAVEGDDMGKAGQNLPAPSSTPADMAPSAESLVLDRLKTLIVSTGTGQQGLLYKLADMIARTLKLDRLPGEPGEKFLARLAAHLENMPANQRLVAEMRTGMTAMGINLVDLARALRAPSGPLAARLVARAEATVLDGRTGSADAVTLSYLDDGAGEHRSTETVQAQKAARASADGQNLFAPHVKDAAGPDRHPPDARLLQNMLTRAYREDAQGRTAMQAPTIRMAVGEDAGTNLLIRRPPAVEDGPAGLQGRTGYPRGPAEPINTPGTETNSKTKGAEAGYAARSNGADNVVSGQKEIVDNRPAMLILRGLNEVVTQFTDRGAGIIRAAIDRPTQARPFPDRLVEQQTLPVLDPPTGTQIEIAGKATPNKPVMSPDEIAMERPPFEDAATPGEAGLSASIPRDSDRRLAAIPDAADREVLRQAFREPLPVPYATIPYPVEDEPENPARNRAKNRDEDDEDRGSSDGDDDQDRHEGRTPPDEATAVDESDDEEELPTICRSSSDAERAYHHYLRMRGF